MKNVKFRGIPRNKDEFRVKKFREYSAAQIPRDKTQISRLGSKYRGAAENCGPY